MRTRLILAASIKSCSEPRRGATSRGCAATLKCEAPGVPTSLYSSPCRHKLDAPANLTAGRARAAARRAGKPSPDERPENDREDDREERVTDAHVGRRRAAQICGQQDRAEEGGAGNHVEDDAAREDDPEAGEDALGIPEPNCRLHDRAGFTNFPT